MSEDKTPLSKYWEGDAEEAPKKKVAKKKVAKKAPKKIKPKAVKETKAAPQVNVQDLFNSLFEGKRFEVLDSQTLPYIESLMATAFASIDADGFARRVGKKIIVSLFHKTSNGYEKLTKEL